MTPFRTPAGLVLLPTVPARPVPRALLASVLRVLSDALGVREAHLTEAVPAPGGPPQRVLWLFTGGGSDPGAVPHRIARDRRVRLVGEMYSRAEDETPAYSALLPSHAPDLFPGTLIVALPDRESAERQELRALGCQVTPQYPHVEDRGPPPLRAWKLDDGEGNTTGKVLNPVALGAEAAAEMPIPAPRHRARRRPARSDHPRKPALSPFGGFLLIVGGVGVMATITYAREAHRQAAFESYDARFGALETRVEALRAALCTRRDTVLDRSPVHNGEAVAALSPEGRAAGLRELARIERDLNAVPPPPPGYRWNLPGDHARWLISFTRGEVQGATFGCPVGP